MGPVEKEKIRDLSSAGRASALQAEGHRFEPYRSHFADVAQLAEQLICNQQVIGSIPIAGIPKEYVGIAQLDRASGYGPEGRGFESSCPRFSLL